MVVTCENCNTGFYLDENLIKESGSKVRCSKCRHIFAAYKPVPVEEPGPGPELEETPEDALDFDLSEEPEERTEEDEIGLEDLGLEEEPPDDEPTVEGGAAVQETAQPVNDTPEETLDFDLSEEPEEKTEEDEVGLEDLGLEEESAAEEPTLVEDDAAAQDTAQPVDDAPEETLDLDLSEEPEEKTEEDEIALEDLGLEEEPPDDEPTLVEEGAAAQDTAEAAEGKPSTEPTETKEAPEEEMADAIPVEEAEQEETEDEEQLEEELMLPPAAQIEPQATKRISTPLMFVLLLVLLAGGAFAAFTLLKRFDVRIPFLESYLGAPESAIADPGNLRMTTLEQLVKTGFVENKTAGRLFVIKGKVRNDYPEARKFIMVKGVLYSKEGKPIQEKTVYCGNTLSESDLETLDKATMHTRLRDRFGDQRSNFRVPSGKVIPFLVVFSDLPQDLGEFSVEVVSSASA